MATEGTLRERILSLLAGRPDGADTPTIAAAIRPDCQSYNYVCNMLADMKRRGEVARVKVTAGRAARGFGRIHVSVWKLREGSA